MWTVSEMSLHSLVSLSINIFATTSYPFISAAQWEITSVTALLNSKPWALWVDSSIMPLTRASLSFKGGEQTDEFHRRTVTVLSSDTAWGGNVTCAATCLRFQWVPCLDTLSLRNKNKIKFCEATTGEIGQLSSSWTIPPWKKITGRCLLS